MSEPVITFRDRTLRVEHDGWYLEVKVLASGRQLAVKVDGNAAESNDLIIRPDVGNRVFISSTASEKEPDTSVNEPTEAATPNSGRRRTTR